MKENELPLISVVVPIYNGEKYLKECVNSILQQDYTNIEIILVDDGSTDKTGKIIDEYAFKDNRVIPIHQINSGVSIARNNGINISKGKYITFIDSDDFICKDYISYFYKMIIENNVEIALTPSPKRFNSNTKTEELQNNNKDENIKIWSGMKTAEQMLYYNIVIAPWNKMIENDLIKKNDIKFNPKLAFGEGFNFSMDCFQRAKNVAVGNRCVYNYRVDNPNSVMTKFSLKLINGSIESQKNIKENLIDKSPSMQLACKYANWHTYCDCLNTLIGCNVYKEHIDLYKEIKKTCQKDALCSIKAPISVKEKIKGICYFINPYVTARLINGFRIRKFTVEK